MISLDGSTIFLSASFPSGQRGERFPAADPAEIADAVTAVVRAVLRAGGRIVFGAHPTISPLVLLVAGEYDRKGVVDIYQSREFEAVVPAETLRLAGRGYGDIHWTEDVGERKRNLALMRAAMFGTLPAAGVFVGGMEGILDEFDLLDECVPRFVLAAPGGAASLLARQDDRWSAPDGFEPYVESPTYPAVGRAIVELVAQRGN